MTLLSPAALKRRETAWRKKHAAAPTKHWRVQGDTEADTKLLGPFDEIVVGHWLHVECMSARSVWVRIGNECYGVRIERNGNVRLTHTETIE